MQNSDVLLHATGICKRFQSIIALNDVQIEIRKGEVHALIGENGAGKSTLLKIFQGIYPKDSGEIIFKGQPVNFANPSQALNSGISMIHQEISLVQSLTVAENIWLGREKQFIRHGLLNDRLRVAAAQKLLDSLGITLDARSIVSSLSVANMQLVEIARAVSYKSDLIIMDEPTSALTNVEIQLLYKIIRRLKKEGVTVIFISHKTEEIFEICDRITVLRDGHFIGTYNKEEITPNELIRLIVGRELKEMFPKQPAEIGDVVFEAKNLCSKGVFENVSFQLRKGEILGFSGLMGSGRTEIMRAIFGVDKLSSGEIYIEGKKVQINSPASAIHSGIGMVTEDRLRLGSIYALSVCKNLSLAYLRKIINRLKIVNAKRELKDCTEMVDRLNIKVGHINNLISSLSGGNQQKVMIGRCLLTNPKIIILDEPTRGIDVGSKAEIHKTVSKLAQTGVAVIMVSSELPEILGMSDRIAVIREGKLVYTCDRSEATQESLMQHAFG